MNNIINVMLSKFYDIQERNIPDIRKSIYKFLVIKDLFYIDKQINDNNNQFSAEARQGFNDDTNETFIEYFNHKLIEPIYSAWIVNKHLSLSVCRLV